MKAKLLQKISYGVNQSREVVAGQQENIVGSSLPWRGHKTPPNPVNPAVDAQVRKDFPGLLKRNYRPAKPGEPVVRRNRYHVGVKPTECRTCGRDR
jgi:hypothetical protein